MDKHVLCVDFKDNLFHHFFIDRIEDDGTTHWRYFCNSDSESKCMDNFVGFDAERVLRYLYIHHNPSFVASTDYKMSVKVVTSDNETYQIEFELKNGGVLEARWRLCGKRIWQSSYPYSMSSLLYYSKVKDIWLEKSNTHIKIRTYEKGIMEFRSDLKLKRRNLPGTIEMGTVYVGDQVIYNGEVITVADIIKD